MRFNTGKLKKELASQLKLFECLIHLTQGEMPRDKECGDRRPNGVQDWYACEFVQEKRCDAAEPNQAILNRNRLLAREIDSHAECSLLLRTAHLDWECPICH